MYNKLVIMKSIYLYEVKLLNGEIKVGEIVSRDDKGIWLRLNQKEKKKIKILYSEVMSIREMGWRGSK
ncbi:MAG: hypothetical protein ABIL02_03535 [candidate division WOR-3 bacterium]